MMEDMTVSRALLMWEMWSRPLQKRFVSYSSSLCSLSRSPGGKMRWWWLMAGCSRLHTHNVSFVSRKQDKPPLLCLHCPLTPTVPVTPLVLQTCSWRWTADPCYAPVSVATWAAHLNLSRQTDLEPRFHCNCSLCWLETEISELELESLFFCLKWVFFISSQGGECNYKTMFFPSLTEKGNFHQLIFNNCWTLQFYF